MDIKDSYVKYEAVAKFTTQRLLKQIVISALGYIILVTTHIGWGPPLIEHSQYQIPVMQKEINEQGRKFFQMYSNFGSGDSQCYTIFFLFLFCPDLTVALFIAMGYPMANITVLIFKLCMQNPRPFWYSTEIKPDHCSDNFGNPSGHSFNAAYFMSFLYFRFVWRWIFGKGRINRKTFGMLVISGLCLAFIHILMEISRMFLGMHSANQIILGASMGTWQAIVFAFVLLPYFEAYVAMLKETSDVQSMAKMNRMVLLGTFAFAAFYISLMAILYTTVFTQYEMPADMAAVIAACKGKPSFTYHASPFIMLLTSYASFPFGIFLGLQFRWQFKRGWSNQWVDKYDTTKYKVLKWTMRFLAGSIMIFIPMLYAIFFQLIFGYKLSITVGLLFNWIPIVVMNGFIVACGLHTFLTRVFMAKCGYPDTLDNLYLSTSMPYSIVQTENSSGIESKIN